MRLSQHYHYFPALRNKIIGGFDKHHLNFNINNYLATQYFYKSFLNLKEFNVKHKVLTVNPLSDRKRGFLGEKGYMFFFQTKGYVMYYNYNHIFYIFKYLRKKKKIKFRKFLKLSKL